MTEFTGERVIPGEVNDDLWAEHIARYAFSSRYATNAYVLDIGSGTGYGVAELAAHAHNVTGIDVAPEAIEYATAHYPLPNVRFLQNSATSLPFAPDSFDLITAFEVIEHLSDWKSLLSEAQRVLRPNGIFLVSTPNKLYYAESRAKDGPNPFHEHEFEFAEFRTALASFFPAVSILLQNRLESFSFCPEGSVPPLDAHIAGTPRPAEEAHFFLAICSRGTLPEPRGYLYVPSASNLLRERERHIALLAEDLRKTIAAHQELVQEHGEQTQQLEERNRWALQVDDARKAALDRIAQLQDEFKAEQARGLEVAGQYERKLAALEQENREKTQWALDLEERLTAELAAKGAELVEAVRLLDAAEATVTERTLWAQTLRLQLDQLKTQMDLIRQSRWIKLGRSVGVGPELDLQPGSDFKPGSDPKVNR